MFKKRYMLTADVETVPITDIGKKVDPWNSLVYDIGYTVNDCKGNIVLERSFIVAEIFFGEREKMNSAYYREKIPSYLGDIAKGERIIMPINVIRAIMNNDIKRYDINIFNAFNARFDISALNNTVRYFNENDKYFFKKYLVVWDIMKMAKQTIYTQKKYNNFCVNNGFLTNKGNINQTAEAYYAFITKNPNFCEAHKGLDDVKIELAIYKACIKMHKKMERRYFRRDID